MKTLMILVGSVLLCITAYPQKRQTFSYKGIISKKDSLPEQFKLSILVTIGRDSGSSSGIYEEIHSAITDTNGVYHIEIGGGRTISGQFDSIIWSDGSYFLKLAIDSHGGMNYTSKHFAVVRIPSELTNDHMQGTEEAGATPEWGTVRFANARNKRPKKITIDLTTSYINESYPADTYPIYRHYEWSDPDRNGMGNAFTISYSENTNNAFAENTTKLGEVRLYSIPFQELLITSTTSEIIVALTEPVPVTDHGRTFAIKGPWKFIYFIEW